MTSSEATEASRGFRVYGRVQGVGFRWWTRRTAAELGVRGHVRNLSSGAVEVHAAGPAQALEELERALAGGPPMSRVTSVEVIEAARDLPAAGFHIELR